MVEGWLPLEPAARLQGKVSRYQGSLRIFVQAAFGAHPGDSRGAEVQRTASAHMQAFPAHKLEEQLGDTRWPVPRCKLSTLSAGGFGDSLGGRMSALGTFSLGSWGKVRLLLTV